jgi:hypothetical protein
LLHLLIFCCLIRNRFKFGFGFENEADESDSGASNDVGEKGLAVDAHETVVDCLKDSDSAPQLIPCPYSMNTTFEHSGVAEIELFGHRYRYVICPDERLPYQNTDLIPGVYEGG